MRKAISVADERWPARAGLVIGLAAAVALVLAFRIPGGEPVLGASVAFTSAPIGELAVSPAGMFLESPDLRAGAAATGRFTVTNLTGRSRAVSFRAVGGGRDLDEMLHVQIRGGPVRIFVGTLASLRGGTQVLTLRPGERRQLTVRMSVPASADGVSARSAHVALRPSSTPLAAS
jgi:hypothetical protein